MLLRILITVHAADLHWKHRHPVTKCFYSTLLWKKHVWAGALERFWLLTSVFLFTRCPNQLETSSLSLKPLTSSQQTVRFHLIYCPPSLCFLSFTILLSCDFLSIFLSCFIETLEKNTSGAHLEQIKICFHSARAITLDYTISILYPLVKIIRKRPIVIRWLTCW